MEALIKSAERAQARYRRSMARTDAALAERDEAIHVAVAAGVTMRGLARRLKLSEGLLRKIEAKRAETSKPRATLAGNEEGEK